MPKTDLYIYGWDVDVDDLMEFAIRRGLAMLPINPAFRSVIASKAVDQLRKLTGLEVVLVTASEQPIRNGRCRPPGVKWEEEETSREGSDDGNILMLALWTCSGPLPLRDIKATPSEEQVKCLTRIFGFPLGDPTWRTASRSRA